LVGVGDEDVCSFVSWLFEVEVAVLLCVICVRVSALEVYYVSGESGLERDRL
jgi:hypothetical protein